MPWYGNSWDDPEGTWDSGDLWDKFNGSLVTMDFSAPRFIWPITATPYQVYARKGTFTFLDCYNANDALVWLQCFDTADATSIVLGTTVPFWSLPMKLGATELRFDASFFGDGLVLAATTEPLGSAPPTYGLLVNLGIR